ncbi:probable cyclin-dependent serine/threonine-protein kinase DDB_G0292550 [Parasteatoda tepidariorum]|uniref:probable cyclin-dependent serine/threonine-protein kinase DDB_G0292550 n=1 Tax=Parasteatoda tepidariorum TaxID=114398 RepID=UPI00077F851B|nr:putative uncharacterized protein DDB_G0282133 [Parasteatoda tepidariorum]XP_021003808.1 putative uncharacterized protein DDB_G0282133 [Parasteatoda tepidariorum]XP_021003809.1 putative uncharacterized protein DDB_G0282133 [Parasteatoda tepidariorum]
MPGSLLLGADTYSDVSEYSGRSLDSKIGGKKVSFNKAVRVKQYPWKPDVDVATSEHLTLPSNRFWFKVYKNKHDTPVSYDYSTATSKQNNWEEESMECIHDSLAPIAEVDDQEIETSPKHTNNTISERNGYERSDDFNDYNGSYKSYDYQPIDPPVDYFDEMRLTSNRGMNGARRVWGENDLKNDRPSYDPNPSNISSQWNGNGYHRQPDKIDENSENSYSMSMSDINGLPRSSFRNDFATRRSMRRLDNSDGFTTRGRRSRSHDEYMDNDSRFKHLKKADKAVSTDDLNNGNVLISPSNRFFKGSRDIATQCHLTLTRNKSQSSFNNLNMSSTSQANSHISNTERLKNFTPQRPRLNFINESNSVATSPKKDYSLEKVSSIIRTRTNSPKSNDFSAQTGHNYKQYGHESEFHNNTNSANLKPLARTENNIATIMQNQANRTFNRFNPRSESIIDTKSNRENTNRFVSSKEPNSTGFNRFNLRSDSTIDTKSNRENSNRFASSKEPNNTGFNRFNPRSDSTIDTKSNRENSNRFVSSKEPNNTGFTRFNPRNELKPIDTKNNRENTNRHDAARETNGVGYLRGHQIPLSEVNTNTNRKFMGRSNGQLNQNHISRKIDENQSMVKLPSVSTKPDLQSSKGFQTKRYLSPPNNHERRSFRNGSNSAKSYASEGDSSMIDWSLSGFQLASKPENGLNSVSDSEYTVHRRPPLLMYIPGVSHHDRPAIEDDRLSALSDISRSELNDGLSSLAGSSRDRSVIGDLRRRQSMREGKSKWLKWRSKS